MNTLYSTTGLLTFTDSTINPLFDDLSLATGLNAAGFVFPGISNDATVAQTFSLASLHFQALAAGNISISVNSDLADFNQGLTF